ncbi:hypothetical protein [Floridanema evergladense]|uniref:Uncharacterized protein n=1 Tax=Floridaenema evergladense BLCC-F167 TaxID=3153639 RepID=A0ABV4WW41_9CYAN
MAILLFSYVKTKFPKQLIYKAFAWGHQPLLRVGKFLTALTKAFCLQNKKAFHRRSPVMDLGKKKRFFTLKYYEQLKVAGYQSLIPRESFKSGLLDLRVAGYSTVLPSGFAQKL